ncbi:MAG: NUDIX hydrolase [Candidatus Saccharimonas sp.]
MDETPPKTQISTRVAYQNPWITVHEDETVAFDGSTGIYGYVESKDSVIIAVINEQREVFLVRGFRYPTKSWGWELPGGGGDGENLLDASKRELEEETGLIANSWTNLGSFYVCNGLLTEQMGVFVAQGHRPDGQKEESTERFADMRFFSLAEIDALIQAGEVNDCQTITALYLVKSWLVTQ